MGSILTLLVIGATVILAIALAFLPMQVLLAQMTRGLKQFIERQRERRRVHRETPERRKPA
jgi:hypothetical protein